MADHGPFEDADQARAAVRQAFEAAREGRGDLRASGYAMLNGACSSCDVRTGDYDRRIMDHLAGVEVEMCAVFAGLVHRAYEAGKAAGPGPGAETEWAVRIGGAQDVSAYAEERAKRVTAMLVAYGTRAVLCRREVGPWAPADETATGEAGEG